MRDKNKYIDEIIDAKLRKSSLKDTSGDFTQHLMKRIIAENKALAEERKGDRIVKYVIGSFSFLMIAFTFTLGFIARSSRVSNEESGSIAFDTMQRSNSILETLVYYVESFFSNVLSFFGVSLSSGSVNIILVVALVALVYFIGERLIMKSRLKQSMQTK